MIRQDFIGKKIAVFGASIPENGRFIHDIRSYFMDKKETVYIFNRAIGGTSAVMAKSLIDEEILTLKPDIVFFSYGANDLGIWLYDSLKEETEELLKKRRARIETHLDSVKYITEKLLKNGIKPIWLTTFACHELLTERDDIETVCDNKEKEDYIGPSFYKRETFRRINKALKETSKEIKEMMKGYGVEVFDVNDFTYDLQYKKQGMYRDDGIHLTKEGHDEVAKYLLKRMGAEDVPEKFVDYPSFVEIEKVEHQLRDIMSFKRPTLLPENVWPKTTDEDVFALLKKKIEDPNSYKADKAPFVLENYYKIDEIRKKEYDLVMNYKNK